MIFNNDQTALLDEMYHDYLYTIKPLISEIEINYEKFPTPIYNEIRSYNDHIARCYTDDGKSSPQYVDEQLKKARSHINRIILDCYKFLNVFYSDKINEFAKRTKRIDLQAISNGDFYIEYKKKVETARKSLLEAKRWEYQSIKNKDYDKYQDAYNNYVDVYDYINANMTAVMWARAKFWRSKLLTVLFAIGTFIGGLIVEYHFPSLWERVLEFIGNMGK